MRHRVAGKRLNRGITHRTSLRKNLMTALILNERIQTTDAKAVAIRGEVENVPKPFPTDVAPAFFRRQQLQSEDGQETPRIDTQRTGHVAPKQTI